LPQRGKPVVLHRTLPGRSAGIEENESVLLVLAHALATHPKQTMTAVEIDAVIASAMGNQVLSLEHRRRADWRDRELPANCFPKSLPNRSFFVSFLATNLRARHNSNFFPKKKFDQPGLFDKKVMSQHDKVIELPGGSPRSCPKLS
jgi:hypothetical protein